MGGKQRILIVDDDLMITKTLVDIFNLKGFPAESANSGLEALKIMENEQFSCMLTDIRMPDMNGVELARAALGVQEKINVILMTAYVNDDLVQEGLDDGAIRVLVKPLDIENLVQNIQEKMGM